MRGRARLLRLGEGTILHWNPESGGGAAVLRRRPARDLLDRIPLSAPETIVDLGCGDGEVTRMAAVRWPESRIIGLDSDPGALATARAEGTAADRITYVEHSVEAWDPPHPVDLVFSNAALHLLGDHDTLLPRLLSWLTEEGVLAVQMPRNFDEPSHRCVAEAVRAGPWRDRLEPVLKPAPVSTAQRYSRLLAPRVHHLDVWETVYHHLLDGPDPVAAWARQTSLAPFLAVLDAPTAEAFYEEYAVRVREHYPAGADGRTLFPFRRLFLVAQGPVRPGRNAYSQD